jgi:hypothetical protein
MNATYPTPGGVDPKHAGVLTEAPGHPPLCAHGMNSLTDRGCDLALGRLRRG